MWLKIKIMNNKNFKIFLLTVYALVNFLNLLTDLNINVLDIVACIRRQPLDCYLGDNVCTDD